MAKRKSTPRGIPPAPTMTVKLARRRPLTPPMKSFPAKGNESRDFRGEKDGRRI